MEFIHAHTLACKILASMRAHDAIERAEIAGSIRRQCDHVKDIEIVAIPKRGPAPDLFGAEPGPNLLYDWARTIEQQGKIVWIKTGQAGVEPWPIKEDGKYWRGYLPATNINLDLFLCQRHNWGPIFTIRTGPGDFSRELVTYATQHTKFYFRDGQLWQRGALMDTPEEALVFSYLGLPQWEPMERTPALLRQHVRNLERDL